MSELNGLIVASEDDHTWHKEAASLLAVKAINGCRNFIVVTTFCQFAPTFVNRCVCSKSICYASPAETHR